MVERPLSIHQRGGGQWVESHGSDDNLASEPLSQRAGAQWMFWRARWRLNSSRRPWVNVIPTPIRAIPVERSVSLNPLHSRWLVLLLSLCFCGCVGLFGWVPGGLRDTRVTEGLRPAEADAFARVAKLERRLSSIEGRQGGPPPPSLVVHLSLALEASGDDSRALQVLAMGEPSGQVQTIEDAWLAVLAAHLYHQRLQPNRAEPLAAAAATFFRTSADRYGQAWAQLLVGQIALDLGAGAGAVQVLKEGSAAAQATGDTALSAQATAALSRALALAGGADGFAQAQRSVELVEGLGGDAEARTLWDAAMTAQHLKKHDLEVSWLGRCAALVEVGAAPPTFEGVGVPLARAHLSAGDLDSARAAATLAEGEARARGREGALGVVWLDIALQTDPVASRVLWAGAMEKAGAFCAAAEEGRCVGQALSELARAALEGGQFESSVEYGKGAARAWEKEGQPLEAGAAWTLVGDAELARENGPAALMAYQRARPLVGDEAAALEAQIAVVAFELGRLEDASRYAKGVTAAEDAPVEAQIVSLTVLGKLALGRGDGAQALESLESALSLAFSKADTFRFEALHRDLVAAAAMAGDLDSLTTYGDAALRLMERSGSAASFEVALTVSEGQLSLVEGVEEPGLEWHRALLAWARSVEDSQLEVIAIVGIGQVRRAQARWVEAITLLEVALDTSETANDMRAMGFVLTAMGEVRTDEGKTDEALALLRRAVGLLETVEPEALGARAKELHNVLAAAVKAQNAAEEAEGANEALSTP